MVEMDNEVFKELLFDRVREFEPARAYSDEFWEEVIQYLEVLNFLTPKYNNPKYIIDNIAVNGEIKTKEELTSEYNFKSEEEVEEAGWLKFGNYYVLNLGL